MGGSGGVNGGHVHLGDREPLLREDVPNRLHHVTVDADQRADRHHLPQPLAEDLLLNHVRHHLHCIEQSDAVQQREPEAALAAAELLRDDRREDHTTGDVHGGAGYRREQKEELADHKVDSGSDEHALRRERGAEGGETHVGRRREDEAEPRAERNVAEPQEDLHGDRRVRAGVVGRT